MISRNETSIETQRIVEEKCNDIIPDTVYIDSVILGAYYLIGMILISLLIKIMHRSYILCKYFYSTYIVQRRNVTLDF